MHGERGGEATPKRRRSWYGLSLQLGLSRTTSHTSVAWYRRRKLPARRVGRRGPWGCQRGRTRVEVPVGDEGLGVVLRVLGRANPLPRLLPTALSLRSAPGCSVRRHRRNQELRSVLPAP